MSNPILEVENVSFRYDRRLKSETLSSISFIVSKSEWLAIVGQNGSGKSTLAKLLIGLLEPDNGRICITGKEMNDLTKLEIRRQVGMVFQNPDNQFIGTTVQDDVAFSLENLDMPYDEMKLKVEQALEVVGLTELRHHDPSRLSGGQKQRVSIAGILALNPELIILDEAFVMLDPASRRSLLTTLKQLQKTENITIISITHDMNEAAVADRILYLQSGQIVRTCTPKEFFIEESIKEVPIAEQVRRELHSHGCNVPKTYMSEEELVNWLCKLNMMQ